MSFRRTVSMLILLTLGAMHGANAQEDQQIIRDAAEALGMLRGPAPRQVMDPINRALFVGSGRMSEYGPNGNWNEFTLNNFRQDMSYHQPAVRQHIDRVDGDGNHETLFRVAREDLAWDETAPGIEAAPVTDFHVARARIREIFILPHGFMTAVVRAEPGQVDIYSEDDKVFITTMIHGEPAKATLGEDMRPERIEIAFTDPLLGETTVSAEYSSYVDFNHYLVFFPSKIVKRLGDRVVLDLDVEDHHQGGYLVWPIPEDVLAAEN